MTLHYNFIIKFYSAILANNYFLILPRGDDKFKMSQKFQKIGDYIWNHHEECIQISTNMPGIGLEMCDILRIL